MAQRNKWKTECRKLFIEFPYCIPGPEVLLLCFCWAALEVEGPLSTHFLRGHCAKEHCDGEDNAEKLQIAFTTLFA